MAQRLAQSVACGVRSGLLSPGLFDRGVHARGQQLQALAIFHHHLAAQQVHALDAVRALVDHVQAVVAPVLLDREVARVAVAAMDLDRQAVRLQVVDDLDRFFFEFDEVVQRFHIEKIKTIGDSYICAGGIPQKNRTNPIEVVLAAFEMQQYLNSIKDQYLAKNQKTWDLRMGIHTGPVFSNTTSNKKRLEIWGDTVNIASRMEASGEIGKVNITG